jgi:DNA-binding transcriptional LysR family regulator
MVPSMKWNIEDVPVFCAVVAHGGMTAAANRLGMPKSSVSKAVARLEHALGLRLLERNTRRVRVTSEGETFFRQCQLIMEQVQETDELMAEITAIPSGRLCVAVPPAFCIEVLSPHLAEFRRRYPLIDLELVITASPIEVSQSHFDLAVVIGGQSNQELVERTLFSGRLVCVASPEYAARNDLGRTPAELAAHVLICERRYVVAPLPVKWNGNNATIDLTRSMITVNNLLVVREAVVGGAGVAFLPDRYCTRQLRSGELVEVARHVELDIATSISSIVFPRRRFASSRATAFVDFLLEICHVADARVST